MAVLAEHMRRVFVSKDVFEIVVKAQDTRVSKLEAGQEWATRTMIGAFVSILVLAVTLSLKVAGAI